MKKTLLLMMVLLIASCNKPYTTTPSKTLVITASSQTSISKFVFFIGRGTTQRVAGFTLFNLATPFTYNTTVAHVGDGISITLVNSTNQPFTASLSADGVDIPSTASGLDNDGLYYIVWNASVPN